MLFNIPVVLVSKKKGGLYRVILLKSMDDFKEGIDYLVDYNYLQFVPEKVWNNIDKTYDLPVEVNYENIEYSDY